MRQSLDPVPILFRDKIVEHQNDHSIRSCCRVVRHVPPEKGWEFATIHALRIHGDFAECRDRLRLFPVENVEVRSREAADRLTGLVNNYYVELDEIYTRAEGWPLLRLERTQSRDVQNEGQSGNPKGPGHAERCEIPI
jgi:hypothetical protein